MKSWSAYSIRFLLMKICETPDALSQQQKDSAGVVARKLLDYSITLNPRDGALIRSGIEAVCRTYESDPVASKTLLSKFLTKENLAAFGFEELPTLAREASRLMGVAPEFVRDIYSAAFAFKETRKDETAMGAGRILSMTSNRRQDYEHALWQLGETFPRFLSNSPTLAVEALCATIAGHVESKNLSESSLSGEEIEVNGSKASLTADASHIWDSTKYRHEPPLKMLDAFEAELARLASDPMHLEAQAKLMSTVIRCNSWTAVWARVLKCGASHPRNFGKSIGSLAWCLPVLLCPDTSTHAGNFITAAYAELNESTRERIERAILSIPDNVSSNKRKIAVRIQKRLLGCIPKQLIFTSEARTLMEEVIKEGGPPANDPPFRIISEFKGPYTDEQFLADQGVSVKDEPNRKLIELTAPLKAFVTGHQEAAPTLTEVEAMIPKARLLREALTNALSDGAHVAQIDNSRTHLADLCACLSRCQDLECTSESGTCLRQLLIEAANDPNPHFDSTQAADFDDHTSWSPAPRIAAACGLPLLAFSSSCVNPEMIESIERLSVDPVPSVRLQLADRLGVLQKSSPATMKKLLEGMLKNDSSSSVVLALLSHPLRMVLPDDPNKVQELALGVFNRADLKGDMAQEVRLSCVSLFLQMFLWGDHGTSESLIREFSENVLKYTPEAERIVASLREIVSVGEIDPLNAPNQSARKKAFSLLESIVVSSQKGFLELQQNQKGKRFSDWPSEIQVKAKRIAQLGDSIASELYFASGAYDAKTIVVSLEKKAHFLKEATSIFDLLCVEPHPSIIHHLIETVQFFLDVDARDVFLRIAKIVKAGKAGGYQYESLAIGLIVDVVNHVFADHRTMLQTDQEIRNSMVEMLDIFVEAGWPQAIQLTYRLDEIFR